MNAEENILEIGNGQDNLKSECFLLLVFYQTLWPLHLSLSLSLSLSHSSARETPCHTVTSGRRRAMEGKGWDHCWLVRARSIASFVNGRGAQRPLCRGKFCGKTFLPLNGYSCTHYILHYTRDNILFTNVQISFQDYFSYRGFVWIQIYESFDNQKNEK